MFTHIAKGLLAIVATTFILTPLVVASAETVNSDDYSLRVKTLTSGLERPWGLAFLPDGRMLVTERPGRLRLITADGQLNPKPITGLPQIEANGQGGLLDIVLHPDYAKNGWLYLSYVASDRRSSGTEVARFRLDGDRLKDFQSIFRMQPKLRSTRHFGSRLLFDEQGYLYITLGDRGDKKQAQQLSNHTGTVVRLHDDGSTPADNPFRNHRNAKAEIYTYGNRNVQGIAQNPWTKAIWAHEHGPQGGDEVNILRPGVNYGWPVITYGVNYGLGTRIGEGTAKTGMAQPIHYWVPKSIAPSGMVFYDGDKFPDWRGDLFIGALRDQMLVRLALDGEKVIQEEHILKGKLGRIRNVKMGPDGYLYLLVDARNGKLIRLEPAR
ncbi:PQQ-dependent oxidoreductase, gdhB family [hydrothermal vent metagenome]|uniref:PQQ-dependent oxidoreductase, gdhB family n=1 Tax=hydrothermal vent metagenome TaxID=652676 RepID=A0A3B1A9H3_9ZZZZ